MDQADHFAPHLELVHPQRIGQTLLDFVVYYQFGEPFTSITVNSSGVVIISNSVILFSRLYRGRAMKKNNWWADAVFEGITLGSVEVGENTFSIEGSERVKFCNEIHGSLAEDVQKEQRI